MKKSLLALILIVILFASCAKDTLYLDSTGAGTPAVPAEGGGDGGSTGGTGDLSGTLLNTKWKMTSEISTSEFSGIKSQTDVFPTAHECDKDNFYLFNPSDVFVIDNGATVCIIPIVEDDDTWKLSADKKKLTLKSWYLNFEDDAVTYDVLQLDNTTLKISAYQTEDMGSGIVMKLGKIFTFKKV